MDRSERELFIVSSKQDEFSLLLILKPAMVRGNEKHKVKRGESSCIFEAKVCSVGVPDGQ